MVRELATRGLAFRARGLTGNLARGVLTARLPLIRLALGG